MKEIVEYGNKLFTNWNLRFALTTNGTLINEEVIDFLIANQFLTTISLDGPEEVHDSKRIFPDGMGTFKTIIQNLEKIKKIDDDYFKKIHIAVTFSKDLDFMKVYEFFISSELLKSNMVRVNFVSERDTNYYDKLHVDRSKTARDLKKISRIITKKKEKNINLAPIEDYFLNSNNAILHRLCKKNYNNLGTSCLFDAKLYIDSKGEFHVCEKINNMFSFGDIDKGFDYQKMEKIAREFSSEIEKKCYNCEFKVLCPRCFVTVARNGCFYIDEDYCLKTKDAIKRRLENIISHKKNKVI